MPLNQQQGFELLAETIRKDLRHVDYDRVTEMAKRYTAYVTGENIGELLIRYNPREDEEAFAQCVALTTLITPYIANRLITPMYKAGRTLATKTISWAKSDKDEENRKKIEDALAKYYGTISLDDYLSYRLVELDSTDPNAFIVTEFPEVNTDGKTPYPFEVNSVEAIDYKYRNNELQYLTVLNQKNGLDRYTIYLDNDAIVAQQITPEIYKEISAAGNKVDGKVVELFFKDEKNKEKDIYIVIRATHKAGRVPAIRVGTKRDLSTRNRTCVPLIHPAKSFFEKSIKTISELDLTIVLHVFPQKITYGDVCPGDVKSNILCIDGKAPSGGACKICNGSGFNEHTSSQDVLRIKMPSDLKEIVSLENFIAYKNPPVDFLELLKKLSLFEIPELAVKAVYTSEIFTADTVATTATEKNIDMDSVYDALSPFTNNRSSVQKHVTLCVAAYLSLSEGITVDHKFPKDFKMKTLSMLLEDLQKANTSGAPSYVKNEINSDIARKIYIDKPDEILKISVKEKFFPFNGKTESEISNIIMNNLCTQFNKVLYANFDLIFEEIESEQADNISFYKMEPMAQKQLIVKKTTEFVDAIETESAQNRAQTFNQGDGKQLPGDSQDFNVAQDVMFNGETATVIDANPGPGGGSYTIRLSDGTEKEVTGNQLSNIPADGVQN